MTVPPTGAEMKAMDESIAARRSATVPLDAPRVDVNVARSDLFYYSITFTRGGDFSDAEQEGIVSWHRGRGDYCYLIKEYHKDGRKHYHSMIAVMSPKTPSAIVKNLERLYEKLGIPWQKGVSVKVKKLTHINGYFGYMLKSQDDEEPLYLHGWAMSWMKEQSVANIKEIPFTLLKGQTYMVQKNTSVELVLRYAKASGNTISCKASFIDVTYSMQTEGYQFDNIKKSSLYSNVMARVGCMRESKSVWEMELLSFD